MSNHEKEKSTVASEFSKVAPSRLVIDESLELRTLTPEYADKLFALTDKNRTELARWLPWVDSTRSASDSLVFINSVSQKRNDALEAPFGIFWNNQLVGHASLMARADHEGEIGYWLDKDAYGHGLATKSAGKLANLGLNELGCSTISIFTALDNDSSAAVAERLNFEYSEVVIRHGDELNKYIKMRHEHE